MIAAIQAATAQVPSAAAATVSKIRRQTDPTTSLATIIANIIAAISGASDDIIAALGLSKCSSQPFKYSCLHTPSLRSWPAQPTSVIAQRLTSRSRVSCQQLACRCPGTSGLHPHWLEHWLGWLDALKSPGTSSSYPVAGTVGHDSVFFTQQEAIRCWGYFGKHGGYTKHSSTAF